MYKRFSTFLLILLIIVVGREVTYSEVLRVPEDYETIQAALDVGVTGDVVSVAPGVYNENVVFTSDGVTLLSRVPHAATIDAGGEGHVVVLNNQSGIVEGFVISGSGDGFYGGVFTSQSTQVIRNNIITGNNHGINISSGSFAEIVGNRIIYNGSYGTGISVMTESSASIVNNYIEGNRYGIECWTPGPIEIVNNTIVNNTKWSILFADTTATVMNNILFSAEIGIIFAGSYNQNITEFVSQFLTISYNDVWQNSMYNYYAELGGIPYYKSGPFMPLPGTGEISVDPLLGGDEGFLLQTASPCIDAANNEAVPAAIMTDLIGNPRFVDDPNTPDTGCCVAPIVDMGAYEYQVGELGNLDISVSKTDSPDPVTVGNNLTYTITVSNNGPETATGVILTDTLPSSVTYVSATSTLGSCSESGNTVTCNIGTLSNGASATVTIVVTPITAGTITNNATVTCNETDSNPSNNTATATTTVNTSPTGCSSWAEVISKYDSYVAGQANWNDVITCYQEYASSE
jgi:uncharacterized repeat protein (TIGR01451 family)